MSIIDQLHTPAFLKELGFEKAKVDTNNIIVMGHSFGGITALGAIVEDKRIRSAIGLDPWFFPHYQELNDGWGVKSQD